MELNYDEQEILDRTIKSLIDMNVIKSKNIILKHIRRENFANIVFTPDIYNSSLIVKNYLKSKGINLIGRFGEWKYLWSDQAILSGKKVARSIHRSIKNE